MLVKIWDLDYYYAKSKKDLLNVDAMKISSFHKQKGDSVFLVETEADLRRPADVFYAIKEKKKTPNPPLSFYLNPQIRWWGEQFSPRINWKMNREMIAARPDYLLYRNRDTKIERSDYVRFLDENAALLPQIQNFENTFKNKFLIVADKNLWTTSQNNLKIILKLLQKFKNIYFLHEIDLEKILSNRGLQALFIDLKFRGGTTFLWKPLSISLAYSGMEYIQKLKERNPSVDFGNIVINYTEDNSKHWEDRQYAIRDFKKLQNIIITFKRNKIKFNIQMPTKRLDTPFFFIFEELAVWTTQNCKISWIEYITHKFSRGEIIEAFWATPWKWPELYRDLLRQTCDNVEFLIAEWGEKNFASSNIPIEIWKKEFKYGL